MNVRRILTVCVWVYCLSWAFDYRSAEGSGGSAVQFIFFGLTLLSGFVITLLGIRRIFALPMGWLTLTWGLYLLSTGLVAVVNHVEVLWYFRNVIPPFLLFLSLLVTQVIASSGLQYKHVLWPLLIASVVNLLWRAVYALMIAKIPIEMVRVELLSPCAPFVIAYLFCGLAFSERLPWSALLVGGVGILSYVLSVTRSAVFIFAAAAVGVGIVLWQVRSLGALPRGFSSRKGRQAIVVAGLMLGAVLLTAAVAPFVIERWVERLFYTKGAESSSADPSALTRYAETTAFLHLLNDEPSTWVYGRGLGAPYYWDETFVPELAQYTYGNEDEFRAWTAEVRFPGHSIWTYAIFSGGIIGACFSLGIFGMATARAYRSQRLLGSCPDIPLEVGALAFISLLAFLSQSLTFNPFIERAGGLVLGIVMGFPQFLYYAHWRRGK